LLFHSRVFRSASPAAHIQRSQPAASGSAADNVGSQNEPTHCANAQGYIIIPGVLTAEQLTELNAVYDEMMFLDAGVHRGPAKSSVKAPEIITDPHGNTYPGRRFWSKAYRDLVDNPTMLPILTEILGDSSWGHAPAHMPDALRPLFRLDHHNIHYRNPLSDEEGADEYKNGAPSLHGGPNNWHITCVYELKDVQPGAGGFGAAAGSQTPDGFAAVRGMPGIGDDARTQWADSRWTQKHPDWDDDVAPLHRVEGKAGDCILFTEKMTQ
jgi:hypothetical protein